MDKCEKTEVDQIAEIMIYFIQAVTKFMTVQMEINKGFVDFMELQTHNKSTDESRRFS